MVGVGRTSGAEEVLVRALLTSLNFAGLLGVIAAEDDVSRGGVVVWLVVDLRTRDIFLIPLSIFRCTPPASGVEVSDGREAVSSSTLEVFGTGLASGAFLSFISRFPPEAAVASDPASSGVVAEDFGDTSTGETVGVAVCNVCNGVTAGAGALVPKAISAVVRAEAGGPDGVVADGWNDNS
jgi:hypothetical protein